jgi:hypothetical protein
MQRPFPLFPWGMDWFYTQASWQLHVIALLCDPCQARVQYPGFRAYLNVPSWHDTHCITLHTFR